MVVCFQTFHQWINNSTVSYQNWENYQFGKEPVRFKATKTIAIMSAFLIPNYDKADKYRKMFTGLKRERTTSLNPTCKPGHSCGILILSNIAQSEWYNIKCNQPYVNNIFCLKTAKQKAVNFTCSTVLLNTLVCSKTQVKINQSCFELVRFVKNRKGGLSRSSFLCTTFEPKSFQFLFDSISVSFPPIMFNECSQQSWTYIRLFNIYTYLSKNNSKLTNNTLSFQNKAPIDVRHSLGGNVIKCSESYFSVITLIDNKWGCFVSDLSVKLHNCTSRTNQEPFDLLCSLNTGFSFGCYLFFKTRQNNCTPFFVQHEDKNKDKKNKHTNLEDLNPELKHSVTKSNATDICSLLKPFPCGKYSEVCYTLADICVYKLNQLHQLEPCKHGGHIEDCIKFQCNMMFKCPKSYCIPWLYVCDGKWDCPSGSEESAISGCAPSRNCSGLFKCDRSHICIHLGNICDEFEDCWFGDDEQMCQLQSVKCPHSCTCLGFALRCYKTVVSASDLFLLDVLQVVSIIDSKILQFTKVAEQLKNSMLFSSIRTGLKDVCKLYNSWKGIVAIDNSYNDVYLLEPECFSSLPVIKIIKLNNNVLTYISVHAFVNLPYLLFINLRENKISVLEGNVFENVSSLFLLHVQSNSLAEIHLQSLANIKIKYISADDFKLCCVVPEAKCSAKQIWFETCGNLFPNAAFEVGCITIALVISLLSSASFLIQDHSSFGYVVMATNLTDLLCATYLFGVFAANAFFGQMYVLNEHKWQSSFLCFLMYNIILLFCILSPTFLLILALCRYQVVKWPLEAKFKQKDFTSKLLSCVLFVMLVFSATGTVLVGQLVDQVSSSLCLPFLEITATSLCFKIATIFVAVFQSSMFGAIVSLYICLVQALDLQAKGRPRAATSNSENREYHTKSIIAQVVLLCVSNLVCWLPSNFVFLSVMNLKQFPIELVFWNTLLILPLNSMVNPCIFIYLMLRKPSKTQEGKAAMAYRKTVGIHTWVPQASMTVN